MAIQNGRVNETDGQCNIRKRAFMKELKKYVGDSDVSKEY